MRALLGSWMCNSVNLVLVITYVELLASLIRTLNDCKFAQVSRMDLST